MESRSSLEVTRDNIGDEGEHTHKHTHTHTCSLTVIVNGGLFGFFKLGNAFCACGKIALLCLFVVG